MARVTFVSLKSSSYWEKKFRYVKKCCAYENACNAHGRHGEVQPAQQPIKFASTVYFVGVNYNNTN